MSFFLGMIAISCLVSGAGLVLGALVETRHAFLLWRARKATAKDLVTGASGDALVEISGPARAKSPLRAPLTGIACIQFTVVLERAQPKRGQTRDGDPDLITFVGGSPFTVDDGTGSLDVDLRAKRVPVTGTRVQRRPLERLTTPLEKMLAVRLGKPGGMWCHGRDVTATEALLVEGAKVSVIARRRGGSIEPLHVTTGRVRVVALQGLMRATAAMTGGIVLVNVWNWLR